MRDRAPLRVNVKVRVTLMNLLVAVAADLPAHILGNVCIRQLGNERVPPRFTYLRTIEVALSCSKFSLPTVFAGPKHAAAVRTRWLTLVALIYQASKQGGRTEIKLRAAFFEC